MVLNYVFDFIGINSTLGYVLLVALPISWYSIGILNKDQVRKYMFYTGKYVSSKCSKIPYWEKCAEPLIIRQFAVIFTAGDALIEGMISDNKNKKEIGIVIEEFEKSILDDINENDKVKLIDSESTDDKKVRNEKDDIIFKIDQ